MRNQIKLILFFVLTIATLILLNSRLGQIPPTGKFLDPIKGIWQNALIPDIPKQTEKTFDGLKDQANIVFNKRSVPHIFAQNDHDLYFAAGYVMAMHRLWQMEFTAHAGLGRISELIGEQALEFDRYLRRIGMHYGAEKIWELLQEDEEMKSILGAYTAGVNAWISQLKPRHYPFEYKLMDYSPEPWTELKTCALVMNISRTLSLHTQAVRLSHMKAFWGRDAVIALFPGYHEDSEPIVSRGTRWDFDLEPPQAPAEPFIPQFILENLFEDIPEGIGSNNWAVAPWRSLTGNALFATDPHQPLNLPSMWYELQLNAPGINAYGVTFPGSPFILMGFNEHLSWGNTASTNLVVDAYEIELDENNLNYFYEYQWHPLTLREEVIRIRGGKTFTDSVKYTHHGPILYLDNERPFNQSIPSGHAMRWTALEPSPTLKGLKIMNTSGNVSDFREGLSYISTPPQNYIFTTTEGDIAMHNNGLWPLRWHDQGTFINDGRRAIYDWQGYIPFEYLPHEINPERGFVSSANQVHTDTLYPYFYGRDFAISTRGKIINNNLSNLKEASIADMKKLQLNADNYEANKWLKLMLDSVDAYLAKYPDMSLEEGFKDALGKMNTWNKINESGSIATTIFMQWRDEVRLELWRPLIEPLKDYPHLRPDLEISFLVLFHYTPVEYYASLSGDLPETGKILTKTLNKVIRDLTLEYGPMGENWQWWRFNGPYLTHFLNIQALGTQRMQVSGSSLSPNAIRNSYGPSWRMVAEMSQPVKAWGIYPGGQTGNPASPGYNAFTEDWAQGNYYPLKLYDTFEEAASENKTILLLKKK